jgi:hypothetical protein
MAEYGVSNQAVTAKLRRCGLTKDRVNYSSVLPWKIRPEHRNLNITVLLKAAARQRMGVGKPLTDRKQRELDVWLKKLDDNDVVVMYGRGRSPDGEISFGYHFVPRRPGIDDWIIRKPPGWEGRGKLAAEA